MTSSRRRLPPVSSPSASPASLAWYRKPWIWGLGVLVIMGFLALRWIDAAPRADSIPELRYELVATYPHDVQAYTQGLVLHDGKLYESTGKFGESSIRRADVTTGKVETLVPLGDEIFGEGLCRWNDRWLQLTWRNRTILERDGETLAEVARHPWPHEGWGLTHDGRRLIVSDGTDRLFFVDPQTFQIQGFVDVTLDGRRLDRINELEFVDGYVYANVWFKPYVVKIDPANGHVVGRVDLRRLVDDSGATASDAVLNGLAYDPADGTWLVTGKLWPKLFRIRIKP